MINFQNFEIARLGSEYVETIEEFEKLLLWVTDRLGIVHKTRYELNWGNIVLLMAAYGKIYLLEKIANEQRMKLPDEVLKDKRVSLERNWSQYLNDFRHELEPELNEQFKNSLISNLSNTYENRDTLNELHDLEYFFSERDTIELFLIGSKFFFKSFNLRKKIKNIDDRIKDYILNFVINNLKREYSKNVLEELTISCLPLEFWWRHINLG